MSKVIHRSLIGHQDLSLGQGKVTQVRGEHTVELQQIELSFTFRSVDEIKALNFELYNHVNLNVGGPLVKYYFDYTSMEVPDDDLVIRPDTIAASKPGRYIRIFDADNPVVEHDDLINVT